MKCSPATIRRAVANHKRRRDERRAHGLCLCTEPLAVRDGKQMGSCEGCLANARADAKLRPRTLKHPRRPCGCGRFGRHRDGCAETANASDAPVIAAAIRDARRGHGVSITAFARLAGVSREYMSRVENGRRPPSRKLIDAAREHLGVSVGEHAEKGMAA